MKRREFIILTVVGAAGATMLSACGHPENKLIPAFIPDEDYIPGLDYWKASTCQMCDASCGILVRTREHAANKIEGNALHPLNRGALCARGQAGLQVHYNPDRIHGPKRRSGERGSGQFVDLSWEEAIKSLADKLAEIKSQEGSVLLAAHSNGGVTGLAAEHLMAALGSPRLTAESYPGYQVELASYQESYGARSVPVFDIARTSYLLSFGARFLETWHSPMMYSRAYTRFRQGPNRARGKFVQVEPRMSMTAANADEWIPAEPGTEALVALGIAQVIIRESLVATPIRPSFLPGSLDDFAPEKTAAQTGIPADRIIRVAGEFASAPGLAIGGGTALAVAEGALNMRAVNFLNSLVGNINRPGGVLVAAEAEIDPFSKWRLSARAKWAPLPEQLASGSPAALLLHRANPLFTAPWLADSIKAVPFIASFSSFMDETTMLADLILPDNSNLESWDLGSSVAIDDLRPAQIWPSTGVEPAGRVQAPTTVGGNSIGHDQAPRIDGGAPPALVQVVTLTRPVLTTEYDTRQTADVFIEVGRTIAGEPGGSLPFGSAEELVKAAAGELQKVPGAIPEPIGPSKPESEGQKDDGQFWSKFQEAGVWVGAPQGPGAVGPPAAGSRDATTSTVGIKPTGPEPDSRYPFTFLAYEHPALGYGAEANLPWLQELPEPMTTVIWGSWVEINPRTAAEHSIEDGDLVEVRSASGAVRAPAVLYPAIHPRVIAMPYGQGHTAFGMYAAGRGANAAEISPITPREPAQTVSVNIARVSGEARLIRFGTMLAERPDRPR